MTNTMQAIVQNEYGTSDVLHVDQIERPQPGAGEVLVRVAAAGLDRGTWHLMVGQPYLIRLGFGLRAPKNPYRPRRRGHRRGGGRRRDQVRRGR